MGTPLRRGSRDATIAFVDGEAERRLGEYARTRSGIFTRRDAERLGVPPRRIARRLSAGEWVPVFGVGLRAATTPLTVTALERAAVARYAHPGALSHVSAARNWGLLTPSSSRIWLTVPMACRWPAAAGVRIYRSRHFADDVVRRVNGVPVLSPARTVADLALVLSERDLTAVALSAIQRGLCDRDEITEWQNILFGRPGSSVLARALEEADPSFESILSAEFGQLLAAAGEVLVPRHVVPLPGGGHAVCDFADTESRIDFEVDGAAHHSGPSQVARDKARDRRLLAAGWVTVRYETDDVRRRPDATLADVRRQRAARRGADLSERRHEQMGGDMSRWEAT